MAETVLVTGGTGFVGSWCIVELLRRGYDVRTTVRDGLKKGACGRPLPTPAARTAAAARPPLNSNRTSNETVWSDPNDAQFDAYRRSKIIAERAAWDFMARDGGRTEFTTLLPGAVFGPVLSTDNLGSVKIIQGLLKGQPRALPRIGFWIVDVRDLAELHIRAMIDPAAAGERFIAAGEFMWMQDVASTLRNELGNRAAHVPTRRLPNLFVKLLLPFLPNLEGLAPLLGRQFPLTAEKARRVLGFTPRAAATTIVECARSL
jgi:dihydroflavonol-4-reductase